MSREAGSIAFIGDRTTTTTLAVAVAWNGTDRNWTPWNRTPRNRTTDGETAQDAPRAPLVVEVDPAGGSLAAWLDMSTNPSLSTVVAQGGALHRDDLEPLIRTSPRGLQIIPAPVRSREANRAVDEASHGLLQTLADDVHRTALLDVGRLVPSSGVPSTVHGASAIVLCHRQEPASARAAAVRLERLAESVELLAHLDRPLTIVLIGDQPYGGHEIIDYLLGDESRIATAIAIPRLIPLPDDPLCAAVLAGRVGVSTRRLGRLPLMRAARALAAHLRANLRTAELGEPTTTAHSSGPNATFPIDGSDA
ncbi:MAG: hypothetical protein QNM02_17660 [Acidimicrobiia bacterium]|nr:hypothetical protein [Acidimicrobiia bacterium]